MNTVAEKHSSINTSHPDPGEMVVKKKKNNESNTEKGGIYVYIKT